MLTYTSGDLFQSPADVLVNPVNTVGVMGKGLAREFKRRYPDMFAQYRAMCEAGEFKIGDLWLYEGSDRRVLNFPTKVHWRSPSKPGYIEAGLRRFRVEYPAWDVRSIAFPALGCGHGELDFETQVRPLMEQYLTNLPPDISVYTPLSDRR